MTVVLRVCFDEWVRVRGWGWLYLVLIFKGFFLSRVTFGDVFVYAPALYLYLYRFVHYPPFSFLSANDISLFI